MYHKVGFHDSKNSRFKRIENTSLKYGVGVKSDKQNNVVYLNGNIVKIHDAIKDIQMSCVSMGDITMVIN